MVTITSAFVVAYFCSKPMVTVEVSMILFTLNLLLYLSIICLFTSWKEVSMIYGEVLTSIYASVAITKALIYSLDM